MKSLTGLLVAFFLLCLSSSSAHEFYFGADLSFANEMDDCGVVYRENGQPKDLFALFKDHGANIARVRIWTDGNPTKYSNLADVERSLKTRSRRGHDDVARFPLFGLVGRRRQADHSGRLGRDQRSAQAGAGPCTATPTTR